MLLCWDILSSSSFVLKAQVHKTQNMGKLAWFPSVAILQWCKFFNILIAYGVNGCGGIFGIAYRLSGTIIKYLRLGKASHFLSNWSMYVQEGSRYIAGVTEMGEQDITNLNTKGTTLQLFSLLLSVAIYTLTRFLSDFVCSVLPLRSYLPGFSKARIKIHASLERAWKCQWDTHMGAMFLTHLPSHSALESGSPCPSALWVEEEVHLLLIDWSFGALLGSVHVSEWVSS